MDFFGIGPWEILLILIIALIIFGPGRLPEIAGKIGEGVRKFKMASTEMTKNVSKEIEEAKKVKDEAEEAKGEIISEIKDNTKQGVKKEKESSNS